MECTEIACYSLCYNIMLFFTCSALYCLQFHHLTGLLHLIGQDGIPSWQIKLLQECSVLPQEGRLIH